MATLQQLAALLTQRLTLAAEEIYRDVEEAISLVQEESERIGLENRRLRERLRALGAADRDESVSPGSVQDQAEAAEGHQSDGPLVPCLLKCERAPPEQNQDHTSDCGPGQTPAPIKKEISAVACDAPPVSGRPDLRVERSWSIYDAPGSTSVPVVQLAAPSPSRSAEDGERTPSAPPTPEHLLEESTREQSVTANSDSDGDDNGSDDNSGDSDDAGRGSDVDETEDNSSQPKRPRLRKRRRDCNYFDSEDSSKEDGQASKEERRCGKPAGSSAEEGSSLRRSRRWPRPSSQVPRLGAGPVSVLGMCRYSKKQYCLFCRKPVLKMARHLQHRHADEEDVARAFSLPKNSKQRKVLLRLLRNRGNHVHNDEVLKVGKGVLIPSRASSTEKSTVFLHCPTCHGLFNGDNLNRHFRRCAISIKEPGTAAKHKVGDQVPTFFPEVPNKVSKELAEVLESMKKNEVGMAVRMDKHILNLGQMLCNSLSGSEGSEELRRRHVRRRLQEVGRFLVQSRRTTPLWSTEDFFVPSNWDYVAAAVHVAAAYDENAEVFNNEGVLINLRCSMPKLAAVIESDARVRGDEDTVENARVFTERWKRSFFITPKPRAPAAGGVPLLTFTEDVKKLHAHLLVRQAACERALLTDYSSGAWADLARVALAQLATFNAGSGALRASQIGLGAFVSRELAPGDGAEVTEFERELARYAARIQLGGDTSLLAPPAVLRSIESLVVKRALCGVRCDNAYLFALPRTKHHLCAAGCIEAFAKDCGARYPGAVASPSLQTEVATLCRLLYLKGVDHLTDFMGLDIKRHLRDECFRKETVQLAKLSKIFVMVERGLQDCTGKSVDEIHVGRSDILPLPPPEERPPKEQRPERPPKASAPMKKVSRNENRHTWEKDEREAVETYLASYIRSGKTPAKKACLACIRAAPEALSRRTWHAVKFYTKNQITALRRKNLKFDVTPETVPGGEIPAGLV
ncbi:uncharacterized protein LOC114766589 isoform X2 [Denticeps clupeoides]|nr:uncharacterized protein LOC114766589 isoform X2 [Denticeps clupeoides]